MDEPKERCDTCRFHGTDYEDDGVAFCHRFPKQELKAHDDWCGEWVARRINPAPPASHAHAKDASGDCPV